MNKSKTAAPQADRLIGFHEVNEIVGSKCKTSHVARALAARGKIRAVRLNERVVRFSERSVQDFIAGRDDSRPAVGTGKGGAA